MTLTAGNTNGLTVGQAISGTNIPAGAYITSINSSTQISISAAATAIGLLVSSLAESQAVAFFITFFVLAASWFFDNLAQYLSSSSGGGALPNALQYMSFQTRLSGFWRGLVDSRDVVFFLSVTILSLLVAFRALERRKWA